MKLRYVLLPLLGLLCTSCPGPEPPRTCLKAIDTSAKNLTVEMALGKSCQEPYNLTSITFWQGERSKILWSAYTEGVTNTVELSTITYGQQPRELKFSGKPSPLQPGDNILVEVNGLGKPKTGTLTGNSIMITLTE